MLPIVFVCVSGEGELVVVFRGADLLLFVVFGDGVVCWRLLLWVLVVEVVFFG